MVRNSIAFIFSEALSNLNRAKFIIFISITIITAIITILSLSHLVVINVENFLKKLQNKSEAELFLSDSASKIQIDSLLVNIKNVIDVDSMIYISKTEAKDKFIQWFPEEAKYVDLLEVNPFPSSIILHLSTSMGSNQIDKILALDNNNPLINKINLNLDWILALEKFSEYFRIITLTFGCVFGFLSIFIISNVIRLTLYSRRDLIEIMQLVGAKNIVIKLPYLIEGIFEGIIAGLLTILINYAIYKFGIRFIPEIIFFTPLQAIYPLFYSITIGLIGSYLSLRRYFVTYSFGK